MRVADDLVDDGFLVLSDVERSEQRGAALRELEGWLDQVEACARGEYTPNAGDLEPELFVALDYFLSRSDLGARPWRLLARSLRRDLHERAIESWAEYLEYCEGACIAPASVFVYLLGARFAANGASAYELDESATELARDLAIYAYLVHMVRDLRKDATIHPQLVQLPRVWLAECGIDVRSLAGSAGPALLPLILRVRGLALSRREAALRALRRADALMGKEEADVLAHVLSLYDGAAREIGVLDLTGATASEK